MKRRNFITKTSLTAAGLTLTGLASSNSLFANDPLKIGIIGTGDRGQGLASLIKEIEGMEVTAMCDIIPFRLDNAMKYGSDNTKKYSNYRKLLEDKNVDAVIIATPFSMHVDMAIDALDVNKHIYCEKTLAYGIDNTKRLLEKARNSKKIFQTGHQYHSSRLYHQVEKIVKKGYLGEIALIENQWNRNGDWRRPVSDPKWERMINWRMYREYSGGLTAELCSHQIDFANWLLDDHPVRVTGFGGIDFWKDGRETFDNVHIITEYPNGAKSTYTSLTTNAKGNYKISILGKKGSIVIQQDKAWIYNEEYAKENETGIVDGVSGATLEAWSVREGAPIDVNHVNPSKQALIDFRNHVADGTKPLSNAETGAQVSVIVQMALNAMDNSRVEHWKEDYNF